tara:strand:- start:4172 stop:4492 length:321 start_codon:yes stop_codon:yes gene_type:complete
VESEAKNNNYPAAMRASHPATAAAVPVERGPVVGGGHHCSFQRSSSVQRPGVDCAAGVVRRERAAHAHEALGDLIDAVIQEGGKHAEALADGLRETAIAIAMLREG